MRQNDKGNQKGRGETPEPASSEIKHEGSWFTKTLSKIGSWVGMHYPLAGWPNLSNVKSRDKTKAFFVNPPTKDNFMNTTSASIHHSPQSDYKKLDAVVKRISLGLEYGQYLFVATGGLAAAGGVLAHSLNANTIIGSMVGGAFGFAFWLSHPKP